MRAAIYARYSSDNQEERSIDDQVLICRDHAAREGWTVVAVYSDPEISGAALVNRPGARALLAAARDRQFDVVLSEALDRVSRDQEDTAAIFKRLRFAGIPFVTLAEGTVTELQVGFKGTLNAVTLRDLAAKTRRGHRGRVAEGRSAGGNTYGYDVVRALDARGRPVTGERTVNEEQAAIVRRIFAEYAAGLGPRKIAARLNAEGVASPRGGQWNASTINGNKARRNGVLHNELYIGRLIYNRQTFMKDPETGKRAARPNPKSEWVTVDVPALRIVEQDLWDRVQAIRAAIAPAPAHRRRRAPSLLSGLLICGVCGGPMTGMGEGRIGCLHHRERGTCGNKRMAKGADVERRLFAVLRDQLLAPDAIAAFVRRYHEARQAAKAAETAKRATAERRLAKVKASLAALVRAIEDGADVPTVAVRLRELEAERAALEAAIAADGRSGVIDLHPAAADLYRRQVADLQAALAGADDAHKARAVTIVRSLVTKLILTPGPKRGEVSIEMHGDLAALLALGNEQGTAAAESMLMMVAGRGFEPLTFRL